jgi:pyridoxamine 5'-phosphate oxidase
MDPDALAALRRSYAARGLSAADVAPEPWVQLAAWLSDAVSAGLTESNAMVLSTVDPHGSPHARTVLLKGLDERGLVFFTNYTSRKGRELQAHPAASLLFPWYDLERQVEVTGAVRRVAPTESEAYFATRPRPSRLGAWASRQSEVVSSRAELERRFAELSERWPEGTAVPVPDFWGGFRLTPATVELWQGRPNRLHDRLRYRREGSGWVVERLAP